jgi:transcriptional regulator with XRE-family HTH domain
MRYIISEVYIMAKQADNTWIELVNLRKTRGLNQTQMAKIFGVSTVTYARWETRVFSPDYKTLVKIADYFDVSTDYLLQRPTPHQLTSVDCENLRAAVDVITDILDRPDIDPSLLEKHPSNK